MSAVDAIDHTFGTTSIPSTGIFNYTANQFFCQFTKKDVRCLNSTQFAAQPFDQLCPSGDCWTDCQDLERLYAPLPTGITFANQTAYGGPPNVTLWPLCAGLTNISVAIKDKIAPAADISKLGKFFANSSEANRGAVAAASTLCWQETCLHSRFPERCESACAAVNLLEDRYSPQLAGTRECIRTMCLDILGLPFADQDIVGIGIRALTPTSIITGLNLLHHPNRTTRPRLARSCHPRVVLAWRHHRRTGKARESESRSRLLDGIVGFHSAQCYFSIPLAIAALVANPFTMDPLNAFGLLPVSTNGFLPQIFTLMIMYFHGLGTWYPLLLTGVSYVLNSIVFFAVVNYLRGIKQQGTALAADAYKSLGDIDSCGGMTGIGICLQFQDVSPPAFLIQRYGSAAWVGIRLAPWIWAFATLALLTLAFVQLRTTRVGQRLHRPLQTGALSRPTELLHRFLPGTASYLILSAIFFVGLFYQLVMFYSYSRLGLVDVHSWKFGQVVAISVWVPPLVEYIHRQAMAFFDKDKIYVHASEGDADSGAEMHGLASSSKTSYVSPGGMPEYTSVAGHNPEGDDAKAPVVTSYPGPGSGKESGSA